MAARRAFGSVGTQKDKTGQRKPGYYVWFTWHGQRYKRAAGASKRTAEQRLNRVQVLLERGLEIGEVLAEVFGEVSGSRATMVDLAGAFLTARKNKVRPWTLKRDTQRMNRLLKMPIATKPVGAVRRVDMQRWTATREDAGYAGSNINRELSLLSRFFVWAMGHGYVETNPVRDVERYSEAGRGRTESLTPEECRKLLRAAEHEGQVFRTYLSTLMLTGARRSEILRLRWQDISFDQQEIDLPPEADKIGEGRLIPMAPDLEVELRALSKIQAIPLHGEPYVFSTKPGKAIPISTLRGMMDRTKRRVDLPEDRKRVVGFHVLRHTAITFLRAAGVDPTDIGRIVGHKCAQTTMRYTHGYATSTKAAVAKLAGILSGRDGSEAAVEKGA